MPQQETPSEPSASQTEPVTAKEASRPLSIGLFVAVSGAVCAPLFSALLFLLLQAHGMEVRLSAIDTKLGGIEKTLDDARADVDAILRTELPSVKVALGQRGSNNSPPVLPGQGQAQP